MKSADRLQTANEERVISGMGASPRPYAVHLRRTFGFALPIMIARTALILMFTVDVLITGWAGGVELAYLGLGSAPQLTLILIAIGALQAGVVLMAQALGAEDGPRFRAAFAAMIVHAIFLGLIIIFLTIGTYPLFIATGQTPDIAAGAARISTLCSFGTMGLLLFIAGNAYLEVTGRPRTGMSVMLVLGIVNVAANGVFALGWGGLVEPMGAVGAILTSSVLRWAAAAAVFLLILREITSANPHGLSLSWSGAVRSFGTLGGDLGRTLRRLGLPMGIAQGVESAAFAALVLMAGRMGADALAGYQIAITLTTFVFMLAVGMAGATSMRVGRALGRGALADLRRAGWSGIALSIVISLPVAALFLFGASWLAALFTSDPAVREIACGAIQVVAFMLSMDAAMAVALGALRGVNDVWIPLALQITAFWLIAVPAAAFFGFGWAFGPAGLFLGVILGVAASFAGLAWRFVARTHALERDAHK